MRDQWRQPKQRTANPENLCRQPCLCGRLRPIIIAFGYRHAERADSHDHVSDGVGEKIHFSQPNFQKPLVKKATSKIKTKLVDERQKKSGGRAKLAKATRKSTLRARQPAFCGRAQSRKYARHKIKSAARVADNEFLQSIAAALFRTISAFTSVFSAKARALWASQSRISTRALSSGARFKSSRVASKTLCGS